MKNAKERIMEWLWRFLFLATLFANIIISGSTYLWNQEHYTNLRKVQDTQIKYDQKILEFVQTAAIPNNVTVSCSTQPFDLHPDQWIDFINKVGPVVQQYPELIPIIANGIAMEKYNAVEAMLNQITGVESK